MKVDELLIEYQVRLRTPAGGYEYFYFYADTNIEKFLNKNNIKYTRNMIQPYVLSCEIEEKKIPEKLGEFARTDEEYTYCWTGTEAKLKDKINEILDYLKSKGE